MAGILDGLVSAVEAGNSVQASAIALLDGLTEKIGELITAGGNTVDVTQLQNIVDNVNARREELAAAVVRNTPADNPPTPEPEPTPEPVP